MAVSRLFIADYDGGVTTATLESDSDGKILTMEKTHSINEGGPNPSWLTLDRKRRRLYCLDEGLRGPRGSISCFAIGDDGSLTLVQRVSTIVGPVSSMIYGIDTREALAVAHYDGAAITTWLIDENGNLELLEELLFSLPVPGPVPVRQETAHEHQILFDPSGRYMIVPDLGADLIRVFTSDIETLKLNSVTSIVTSPGCGPRHGVFWKASTSSRIQRLYLFVVGELDSSIVTYAVHYYPEGISFAEVAKTTSFGSNLVPNGNFPAEISVTVSAMHSFIGRKLT